MEIIEDYVMNGHDRGITKATMEKACGLVPLLLPSNTHVGDDAPASGPAGMTEPLAPMGKETAAIVEYMLSIGLDRITASELNKIKAIKNHRGERTLDELVTHGHFAKFKRPAEPQARPAYHRKKTSSVKSLALEPSRRRVVPEM